MLNNKIVFERLMRLLCSIDPKVPLPTVLSPYLWENMEAERYCFTKRTLETEGEVPKNAYYVVKGFVLVYGYNELSDEYVTRIYRENTIVALNCFMEQSISEYTVVAIAESLVYSISYAHMQEIYDSMVHMKEMALKTALKYSEAKVAQRNELLSLCTDDRVEQFYTLFKGLLPPKTSVMRDKCIASYLLINLVQFRKVRARLRKKGVLRY